LKAKIQKLLAISMQKHWNRVSAVHPLSCLSRSEFYLPPWMLFRYLICWKESWMPRQS
jgi:hypothetical protein